MLDAMIGLVCLLLAAEPLGSPDRPVLRTTAEGYSEVTIGERLLLAGGGGNDLLRSDAFNAELSGGAGFDVLLAPNGAARLSPGRDGGLALAGGKTGATFHVGNGLSIIIGSPGPDIVHVWGGFNLIFLRAGDDKVVRHGEGGVSAVFGGEGEDSSSCTQGPWAAWFVVGVERRSACEHPGPEELVATVVVGVSRGHRVVLEGGGWIIENPAPGISGNPMREDVLEIWGVLRGIDPGPQTAAFRPGGFFQGTDGRGVSTFGGDWGRGPELGEPRLFGCIAAHTLGPGSSNVRNGGRSWVTRSSLAEPAATPGPCIPRRAFHVPRLPAVSLASVALGACGSERPVAIKNAALARSRPGLDAAFSYPGQAHEKRRSRGLLRRGSLRVGPVLLVAATARLKRGDRQGCVLL